MLYLSSLEQHALSPVQPSPPHFADGGTHGAGGLGGLGLGACGDGGAGSGSCGGTGGGGGGVGARWIQRWQAGLCSWAALAWKGEHMPSVKAQTERGSVAPACGARGGYIYIYIYIEIDR